MSEPRSRVMDDDIISQVPHVLAAIQSDTDAIGFQLASERKTGSLLRALAASKPRGRFLELGTGTGVGTAWLLAGMDRHSRLVSVETDPEVQRVAKRNLSHDTRVTFHLGDGPPFRRYLIADAETSVGRSALHKTYRSIQQARHPGIRLHTSTARLRVGRANTVFDEQ